MSILIKNPHTDALVRKVAKLKGVSLTEAVHGALERELQRASSEIAAKSTTLVDRSKAFVERLHREHPRKGPPADKEFIDSLYE